MITADDIKDFRQRLGWSQQKLASELGVALQSVSRWERGVAKPSPLALSHILTLMGRKRVGILNRGGK
jgi:DNA-binding transcriptional regulator YiaG